MDEEKTVPGKEDFFLFISPSSNPNGWYNICYFIIYQDIFRPLVIFLILFFGWNSRDGNYGG